MRLIIPILRSEDAFKIVVNAIPPGWQYPDITRAKLEYKGKTFKNSEFEETIWHLEVRYRYQ